MISDTRAACTIGNKTASCCLWDGVQLWPDESLNQPGKCRILMCLNNFDMLITPCPYDISGRYKWIHEDFDKLFPDCCGTKVDTFMEPEMGS